MVVQGVMNAFEVEDVPSQVQGRVLFIGEQVDDTAVLVALDTTRRTRSGYINPHSSARMPPIDPPTTAAKDVMPKREANSASATTWSRVVSRGNREP